MCLVLTNMFKGAAKKSPMEMAQDPAMMEQAKEMMRNPEMVKAMGDMMSNMDADTLDMMSKQVEQTLGLGLL